MYRGGHVAAIRPKLPSLDERAFRMRRVTSLSTLALLMAASASANASEAAPPVGNSRETTADPAPVGEIVVTGRRLDAARDSIAPALGASDYSLSRATLDKQPGGANLSLAATLLQAPGVTQDSYGAIHVRNEHGNLQYRLNGIIVPESISGFGATFDQRIASSIDLITGTLPAQYGYRTSGVINVKTQSGSFANGGEVGIYGGSRGTIQPSASIQGSDGHFNYFASGSYLQNDIGVENPTPARNAIHDRTRQYRGFVYVSDILSESSRISAFGGTSIGRFEIPNVPGQSPAFTVNGVSNFDSAALDLNQREVTHYGVLAYQFAGANLNFQVAPFVRYSQTRFIPDPNNGDIIFNGFADAARLSSLAAGVQADGSTKLGDSHTVRFGVFLQNERTRTAVTSRVLPVDGNGIQTSQNPFPIADRGGRNGQLYGAYLQDEWSVTPKLTINYGARFDIVRAYTREQQLSPRVNLVWVPNKAVTLHAGYARNFTPPPQELIGAPTLALFDGTTKQSELMTADQVRAEREHYFDAGIEFKPARGLKIGLDNYYKLKRNLLDEGQFGSALVLSPFNYAKGYAWGVELSANYTRGPFDVYANVAHGQEKGRNINSSQYFFAPDELAKIRDRYIFTDHSQDWTASGGGSATIRNGAGTLVPTVDFIYGSGLRKDDPNPITAIPNGGKLPGYFTMNLGIAQNFTRPGALKGVTLRVDVANLFDKTYLIRDGSGVGVGAPQYGARRGIFAGITKKF
jgi:outer membrane receptor protein involved in Fe transport